jgi:KUP system potassium uptake protein
LIELEFFTANIHKFPEGGYITLIISLFYIFIMYSVYQGKRISNRFTKFVDLGAHAQQIKTLSGDAEVPKLTTHLIYMTKSNFRHLIEEDIIQSIFSRRPKRADVYWFIHIHRTNEPYSLSYDVSELIDDKVIKVNINVGFRIQPRTELFFKRIMQEMARDKELNLHIRPDGASRYNPEPDFRFVVIEKFLSVENELTLKESILLNTHYNLKQLSLSDEKAFGIEKSDVIIEHVPLLYQPVEQIPLKREGRNLHV